MRKLNTILSVLLLFICLLHGLMGSFMSVSYTHLDVYKRQVQGS